MSLLARCPTLIAICAVIAAMVTMFVWWLPIVIVGGTSVLYWRAARRAERLGANLTAVGAGAAAERVRELDEDEWERSVQREYRNLPGYGDVRGYARLYTWYVGVLGGNIGAEAEDPRELRWWGARLLLIGAVFGTLGRAADVGAWGPALPILCVLALGSLLIAKGGPRARSVAG